MSREKREEEREGDTCLDLRGYVLFFFSKQSTHNITGQQYYLDLNRCTCGNVANYLETAPSDTSSTAVAAACMSVKCLAISETVIYMESNSR